MLQHRAEACQALNGDVALDASDVAQVVRTSPHNEKMLLAQQVAYASHGSHGSQRSHGGRTAATEIAWFVVKSIGERRSV